jgi:Na+-transporting NADH:ubiquinone oxidoreductase subunit A
MEVLRISGGHRFRLKHGPSQEIHQLKRQGFVAFSPRGLSFLKPRILVKEGEMVALGQPLVEHKKDDRIKFCSPASGKVQEIRYGPRRILEAIVIAIDEKKESSMLLKKKYLEEEIRAFSKEKTEKFLLDAGFFGFLDCFPGWGVAPLSATATGEKSLQKIVAVHINLLRTEAHWPDPHLVIKGKIPELKAGILALSKLGEKTRVYVPKDENINIDFIENVSLITVVNKYPADNLGVQAWYAEKFNKNQFVIGADAELAIDIGYFLLHGQKRTERLYCSAGNAVKKPRHYLGRLGMAIGDLLDNELIITEDVRLIAGGLFRGNKVRFQDYFGAKDLCLQAMTEDKSRIPFVFFRLGADRLTMARTWLGGFKHDVEREATTSNNGEERACIQCGYCIDVCPVKLMPNLILKASLIKDIEKMEWLSIHDCTDCGLCTFVCPSKIELGQEIEAGKKLIEKEG